MSAHTPGPWTLKFEPPTPDYEYPYMTLIAGDVYTAGEDGFNITGIISEADARLLWAAPDGLDAAVMAYLALLQLPHGEMRLACQATLATLRDFIAKATGQESEAVQNMFEARAHAAIAHAEGKS